MIIVACGLMIVFVCVVLFGFFWNNRNNIMMNGGQFQKEKIVQEIMFYTWSWIKSFDKSFSYSFVQWSISPGTIG